MLDGIFVFDNVIHMYDLSRGNLREDRDDVEAARDHLLALGSGVNIAPDNYQDAGGKRWTVDELYEMVFVAAPTDMAMAQVVPIFDWFKDFFAPVHAQHELAAAYPDRILFCGGVDPNYRGLQDALD